MKHRDHILIGDQVRKHRKRLQLSLTALANLSGVSKAMLSQIEQNKANPTVAVAAQVAEAMHLTVGQLLGEDLTARKLEVIRSANQTYDYRASDQCSIRTLSPLWLEKDVEFYRIDFPPGGKLESQAHFRQTCELIAVASGSVQVRSADSRELLEEGDSAYYPADVPHCIENPNPQRATVFLVVKYQT